MFSYQGRVMRFLTAAIFSIAIAATGCGDGDGGGGGAGTGGTGGEGGAVAGPAIQMTAPTGSDPVQPGTVVTIAWTTESDVTGVDLSYTTDTAGTVSDPVMIAMDVVGSSYEWTTPTGPLFGVKIKGVANAARGTGEDETDDIFAVVAFSERNYVQGATCGNCHAEHNQWVFQESGHPYKLNKVDATYPPGPYPNGPGVPMPPQDSTPANLTWDDVTYVIGGYGWKARFLDTDGFIIGTGFRDEPTGEGTTSTTSFTIRRLGRTITKTTLCRSPTTSSAATATRRAGSQIWTGRPI
jgi:hypothetical protein